MKKSVMLLLLSLMVFLLFLPCYGQQNSNSNLKEGYFQYSSGGVTYQGYYIYPANIKKASVVILLSAQNYAKYYAQAGFIAVTIQYGQTGSDPADVKEAIKVIKKWDACNGKIGLTGHSMAAALAMIIAAKNPDITSVVEMAGLLHPQYNSEDLSKDYKCAMFFISGQNDQLVSPQQTRDMYERFKKSGNTCDVYIVPNAGHSFGPQEYDVMNRAIDFFKKTLK